MNFTLRRVIADECQEIADLLTATFQANLAQDCSSLGQANFVQFVQRDNLKQRLSAGACMLSARVDGELAGFLELRIYRHIALLFTAPPYQRKGIARRLLAEGIRQACLVYPDLSEITVNATGYGRPAYERLGFAVSGEEQERDGIRTTPMVLVLTKEEL